MGGKAVMVLFPSDKSSKIVKWNVKEGTLVNIGRVILLYDIGNSGSQAEPKKLKATHVGTVRKLLVQEGETVQPGSPILELEECTHPTVFKDMCAECGVDLRKQEQSQPNASVPMVHSIPELKVSEEQAQILGKADETRLLAHRKLVLLVDLDQTLIHTTNDNIPANLKDVYHFQLYGSVSPWYHTRLRPGTHKFLTEISDFYELHICTFGARNYAHMIAMFLDPDGKLFSHRILSRDECFDPNSKTANLKALFPCGDNMVCIIDDREDVWNYASNLIHVKPYHFFQHTGDINAPPGLDKHESDDKEGFDFTNLDVDKVAQEKKLNVDKTSPSTTSAEEDEQETSLSTEDMEGAVDNSNSRTESDKVDALLTSEASEPQAHDVELQNSEVEKTVKNSEKETVSVNKSPENVESDVPCGELKSVNLLDNVNIMPHATDMDTSSSENADIKVKDDAECEVSSENKNSTISISDTTPINSSTMSSVGPLVRGAGSNDGSFVSDDGKSTLENDAETNKSDEDLIEVEDCDDYLLYLEDILKMIHKAFFQHYDELNASTVPDLKEVIPDVRSKVLAGTRLVFSGLVPTHIPLEQSRAYLVARSLGAQVTQDLETNTTHLVAVRSGTAKVNTARRIKGIKKVTPNWLWCCAERWERVDERLFPLGQNGAAYRHPPAHCASPEHVPSSHGQPATRRRTPSGRFMDSINPLMSFSIEDIANMDKEVEDIFNESDESEGEEEKEKETGVSTFSKCHEEDEESLGGESSDNDLDSLSECEDVQTGWGNKRAAPVTDDSDEEMPSVKFRRGEALPSDVEQDESQDSINPPDEEMDDGEWNMMGAALEREFLSGDAHD